MAARDRRRALPEPHHFSPELGARVSDKWAAGIADTLAVGVLCEAYGLGIPTAVLPCLNAAQAAHPAYRQSLERLRDEMGVLVADDERHQPKAGGGRDRFRWERALKLLTPRAR